MIYGVYKVQCSLRSLVFGLSWRLGVLTIRSNGNLSHTVVSRHWLSSNVLTQAASFYSICYRLELQKHTRTFGSTMTDLKRESPLGQLLRNGAASQQFPESNWARTRSYELNKTTSLSWDAFKVERLLGSGTFASVYSVKILCVPLPNGDDKDELTPGYAKERDDETVVTLIQDQTKDHEDDSYLKDTRHLALKCMSNTSPSNTSAADHLVQEAIILQKLPPHPNIIMLLGVSSNLGCEPTGFLLLQRVRETLDALLFQSKLRRSFRKQVYWPLNLYSFTPKSRKEQARSQHLEQCYRIQTIAVGLARAMAFLHRHSVLYRDLKPSNVGIDYQGQVRLFDFGFARTYREEQGHLLTKWVGTPRYMSPEAASSSGKYGFPADVYSFAIILWEISVLRKPFESVKSMKGLLKAVHVQQKRPPLKHVMCSHIQCLLKASWHPNPDRRPTFALIVDQLEKEKTSAKACTKTRCQSC
jgi:serine/threonine protein kinase